MFFSYKITRNSLRFLSVLSYRFSFGRYLFRTVGLVNSQVVLKGIESEGCVLVAAGNARILNRLHIPVWSKGEIFNKNTWFGNVENLQVILLTCLRLM